MGKALGFFEISGVVAATDALDIMCKAADVEFVTWEKKLGGRLGTVIRRTSACRRRLLDYVNGRIDSIPELEEIILPYGGKKGMPMLVNRAMLYMTANIISH